MNTSRPNSGCSEKEKKATLVALRNLLGTKFSSAVPPGFAALPAHAHTQNQATGMKPPASLADVQDGSHAPTWKTEAGSGSGSGCGIPGIDRLNLPRDGISEISVEPPAPGCGLVLSAVLREELAAGHPVALVDAEDCFDFSDLESVLLGRLFWVRCRHPEGAQNGTGKERKKNQELRTGNRRALSGCVERALKVADLLLRDGNIRTVLLDLQACREKELRSIPKSTWFRLRTLADTAEIRCLVFTPRPMVPSARVRLDMAQLQLSLVTLDDRREDIHSVLEVQVLRDRRGFEAGARLLCAG